MLEEELQETASSIPALHVLNNVKIHFRWDAEKKTGVALKETGLEYVEMTESLFDLLPTIHLRFNSNGISDGAYVPKYGDTIHIAITRNTDGDGEEANTLIENTFVIQEVYRDFTISPDVQFITYEILGIHDKEIYLNQRCIYPADSIENKAMVYAKKLELMPDTNANPTGNLMPMKTSCEVIQQICDSAGINLIKETKSNDNSYWLASNYTYAKFIRKLIDHAWIAEDDAPIVYVDMNGDMHYTSLRSLSKNTAYVQRKSDDEKQKYEKTETTFKCLTAGSDFVNSGASVFYSYSDIVALNGSGSIINNGGLSVKQGFFAPFADSQISDKDVFKFSNSISDRIVSITNKDNPESMQIKNESKYSEKPMLAEFNIVPVHQQSHYQCTYDGGMLFPDMHQYYTIAPKHNELLRRAFFQSFIKMSIDVTWQPSEYTDKKYTPRLGTVINVDTSNSKLPEQTMTGKYIISKIVHKYIVGGSYTQLIYGVTDGLYSIGQIK